MRPTHRRQAAPGHWAEALRQHFHLGKLSPIQIEIHRCYRARDCGAPWKAARAVATREGMAARQIVGLLGALSIYEYQLSEFVGHLVRYRRRMDR